MSILTLVTMSVLFLSELSDFLTTTTTTAVSLDLNDAQTVRLNFNVTFHALACDYTAVDVLDSLGANRQNVTKNVEKWQMDEDGRRRVFAGRNKEAREVRHEDHEETLEEMHEDGVHAEVLNGDTFPAFLAENELAFVNFYAPWCIWCQRLHPTWERFAEKVAEEEMPVAVGQVDCVESAGLCSAQKIAAFPSLRWFARQEAVLPDYKQDRTVNALNSFAARKLENEDKYKRWEETAEKNKSLKNSLSAKKVTAPPPLVAGRPDHPGCQVSGYLDVNRVPGNFHIEARSVNHNLNAAMTNLTHTVNHLSFGDPPTRVTQKVKKYLATIEDGHKNFQPMDSTSFVSEKAHRAHHHYLSIVSTHFDDFVKYQFLASSQEVLYDVTDVPEARFSYDLSPMAVTVGRKNNKNWYEFMTGIFAIVGGTFATMGLIDGLLYKAFKPKKL